MSIRASVGKLRRQIKRQNFCNITASVNFQFHTTQQHQFNVECSFIMHNSAAIATVTVCDKLKRQTGLTFDSMVSCNMTDLSPMIILDWCHTLINQTIGQHHTRITRITRHELESVDTNDISQTQCVDFCMTTIAQKSFNQQRTTCPEESTFIFFGGSPWPVVAVTNTTSGSDTSFACRWQWHAQMYHKSQCISVSSYWYSTYQPTVASSANTCCMPFTRHWHTSRTLGLFSRFLRSTVFLVLVYLFQWFLNMLCGTVSWLIVC